MKSDAADALQYVITMTEDSNKRRRQHEEFPFVSYSVPGNTMTEDSLSREDEQLCFQLLTLVEENQRHRRQRVAELFSGLYTWSNGHLLFHTYTFLTLSDRFSLARTDHAWSARLRDMCWLPARDLSLHRLMYCKSYQPVVHCRELAIQTGGAVTAWQVESVFGAEVLCPFLDDKELLRLCCVDRDLHNWLFCVGSPTMVKVYCFDHKVPEHPQSPFLRLEH